MSQLRDTLRLLGIVAGVGVFIGGIVCLAGYCDRCQRCDKWFSKRVINKQKLKEQQAAKDLERADKHYDKDGNYAGETRRKERIYGKYITYDVTIECARCRDQYHETRREWKDA